LFGGLDDDSAYAVVEYDRSRCLIEAVHNDVRRTNSRNNGPVKLVESCDVDCHALASHPAGYRLVSDGVGRVTDGGSSKRSAVQGTTSQGDRFVEPYIGYQARPDVNGMVRDALKRAHDHAASCSTIVKPGDRTTSGRGYLSVAHASSSDSSI